MDGRSRGALEAGLVDRLALWLKADQGVEIKEHMRRRYEDQDPDKLEFELSGQSQHGAIEYGGQVVSWRDIKPHGIAHDFVALPQGQERFAADKLKDQITRYIMRARIDGRYVGMMEYQEQFAGGSGMGSRSMINAHLQTHARLSKRLEDRPAASVTFPCGLVAHNMQLHDEMTVFFVLKPHVFEPGDQAIGQRFFGHYPYGQLRFNSGRVAFKSEQAEYVLDGGPPLHANEWVLVAYRFSGRPEASVNGMPFTDMHAKQTPPATPVFFSRTGYLTVGGTNADCGFLGEMAEVLVFDAVLDDAQSRAVHEYLAGRHALSIVEVGVECLGEHGDGSAYASARVCVGSRVRQLCSQECWCVECT